MATLTDRKREILRLIVSEHVHTAAPVASSTLAKSETLKASSATIRNEMVALEEDGYITRPHISSGGVPSDSGYRQFVASLDHDQKLNESARRLIDQEFKILQSYVDDWIESASAILSGMLSTLAFTTLPRTAPAPIKTVELLKLQEMLVMVVVVLQEATVYKNLISLDASVTDSEVEHTRNRIVEKVVGLRPNQLKSRTNDLNPGFEQQAYSSTVSAVREHSKVGTSDRKFTGISELFKQPEFMTDPSMAAGATWILDDPSSLSALNEYASDTHSMNVVIGRENEQEALQRYSIVFTQYGNEDSADGLIGVLAPTRMKYETAIPAVHYVASHLGNMTSMVYGR